MFEITDSQRGKLNVWKAEQDAKVARLQREKGSKLPDCLLPNYGAIGSGYTYEFTPSSIGMMLTVRNNYTRDTIELTDFSGF